MDHLGIGRRWITKAVTVILTVICFLKQSKRSFDDSLLQEGRIEQWNFWGLWIPEAKELWNTYCKKLFLQTPRTLSTAF
jgi:hypothetical protein